MLLDKPSSRHFRTNPQRQQENSSRIETLGAKRRFDNFVIVFDEKTTSIVLVIFSFRKNREVS